MEEAVQHSPDLGYGAIVPIRTVRQVQLFVAPGEPDNPQLAKAFVLSWFEKDPPPAASVGAYSGCTDGWYFVTKAIGIKGREVAVEGKGPKLWEAMFGVPYAVRLV